MKRSGRTGSDTTSCASRVQPCLTIQYAVSRATSGDDISVDRGSYRGNVRIDKPLTIAGAGAGSNVTAILGINEVLRS